MTHHSTPPNESDEQGLLDFGDRVAGGPDHQPANDLEATVARVHNALRADTSATTKMPGEIKTQIWEDIMSTAPTPAATLADDKPTASKPRRYRRQPQRLTTHAPHSRMAWSKAANIALTLLLLVAGFGAFRAFEGELPFGGGGNDPTPTKGKYALAPVATPPAATATTGDAFTSCDFSQEVPIYNGIQKPPISGTVLYVTPSHDLMIQCDEEPEDILLSRDVRGANATQWPGVVSLGIGENAYEPTPVFLNVQTNEWAEFGFENTSMTKQPILNTTGQSPFIVTALPDDSSTWMMTDLRTMESRTLSELGGVEWPANSSISISDNSTQGTYAISLYNSGFAMRGEPALEQPEDFSGEIMLVSDSLDHVSWVDIPSDFLLPSSFQVSPDGAHIAVLGMDGSAGIAAIGIFDTSDGGEIARTEMFEYEDPPTLAWVQNGDALMYLQSHAGAVMMLAAENGAAPEPMLEVTGHLFDLRKSHDADVVTALEATELQKTRERRSERVHVIHTRSGTTESFEGRSWNTGGGTVNAHRVQTVIILTQQDSSDMISTQIIDPSSGELLLKIPIAPTDAQSTGPNDDDNSGDYLAVSLDEGTSAFTIQRQSLIVADVVGEKPSAREVAFPEFTPPEDNWSTQVRLSPDGTSVQLSIFTDKVHMQWAMDLTDQEATWVEIPSDVWLEFMPSVP